MLPTGGSKYLTVTSVLLPYRRPEGRPDPAVKVQVTIGDKTFRTGRRTAEHLHSTVARLAERFPGAHLHVIQPSYNSSVAASAGTHDYDGVLDVRLDGLMWDVAERFLRECGWAAWWRNTGAWAKASAWHIHMVSLGCPGPVGIYVPGQVIDYYAHAMGLAGQHNSGTDRSWHPADIGATYFNYPAWLTQQEDDVAWTDWPQKDRDQAAQDIAAVVAPIVAKQLLATFVIDDKVTIAETFKRMAGLGAKLKQKDGS